MLKIFLILLLFFSINSKAKNNQSDALLCSSIYFIVSGSNIGKNSNEMLTALQQSFDLIYSANNTNKVSVKDLSKLKHKHLMYLGKLYDNDPSKIYKLEMQCNAWKSDFRKKYIFLSQNAQNWDDVVDMIKDFPKLKKINFDENNKRWIESKNLIDEGFKYWDSLERVTPYKLKQKLKKDLKK